MEFARDSNFDLLTERKDRLAEKKAWPSTASSETMGAAVLKRALDWVGGVGVGVFPFLMRRRIFEHGQENLKALKSKRISWLESSKMLLEFSPFLLLDNLLLEFLLLDNWSTELEEKHSRKKWTTYLFVSLSTNMILSFAITIKVVIIAIIVVILCHKDSGLVLLLFGLLLLSLAWGILLCFDLLLAFLHVRFVVSVFSLQKN